jgi:hypothetical protein
MPTYERLDYGSPDGSHWGGASTDALGMYGVTPVTQYTLVGAASAYASTSSGGGATATTFGFSTAVMFSSMVYQVSTITIALRNIGLIA